MVDKIKKFLDKLSAKERQTIGETLRRIKNKEFKNLDLKKLKGRDDVYRVRTGGMRIIYRIDSKGEVIVLEIGRRNDNTYNF